MILINFSICDVFSMQIFFLTLLFFFPSQLHTSISQLLWIVLSPTFHSATTSWNLSFLPTCCTTVNNPPSWYFTPWDISTWCSTPRGSASWNSSPWDTTSKFTTPWGASCYSTPWSSPSRLSHTSHYSSPLCRCMGKLPLPYSLPLPTSPIFKVWSNSCGKTSSFSTNASHTSSALAAASSYCSNISHISSSSTGSEFRAGYCRG